jgi:hypothetical protein
MSGIEALGVVASVVQVLEVASKFYQFMREIHARIRDGPSIIRKPHK